ncbi:SDR family oxidoreductase [Tsuneonella sp. YG55]|uniref:SDR family oxidoreductase n=1 Tax=Tsuneonella litorea TaxID=2976475 RepID=A0A9X3A851_9SPHN|nr:SDR family oxidoreductase [Tsuneonella litorea]MCT2557505.1 SDR family oxidoreductase [Tsuneonella litorea]
MTGASSGIGWALAKGLSAAGARIVVVARRSERLELLVREIEESGGAAIAAKADVTEIDSVEQAFDEAEAAFGTVDIAICNAGISGVSNFLKTDAAERDAVFDTNLRGVWNVGQSAARRMVAAGVPGSIINVASVLGLGAQPGVASYCASKGAVIQLTRSMALDLTRYGIRVNAVAPGWFKTEINDDYFASEAGKEYIQRMPSRRLGQLDELVGPVVLLASEAGSFMNGSVVVVDGALNTLVA